MLLHPMNHCYLPNSLVTRELVPLFYVGSEVHQNWFSQSFLVQLYKILLFIKDFILFVSSHIFYGFSCTYKCVHTIHSYIYVY